MNYNFKTFEELEKSVKRADDKWTSSTSHANKDDTYKGRWAALSQFNYFVKNEESEYKEKINSMSSTYAPAFLEKQEKILLSEFNEFVTEVKEKERKSIKALADKKYSQVITMLTTAPTSEQMRLLSILEMRNDLDAVEVHNILPVFFSNYQAMKVFSTICASNGISLNLPVQLDCRVMFENINRATEYLLGAVDEIGKPKDKRNQIYNAFFFIEHDDKNCSDPVYNKIIEVFDSIPQLNDCRAEKTGLNEMEQAKVEWYYRNVNDENIDEVATHTAKVVNEHPEMRQLLKFTKYSEYVNDEEKSEVTKSK